ncbi:MAG: hypothetical protein JST58_05670 [Bacteroidetes bacterium]|jgi:hypothetical protein|nr:hypothetical protein [Bacteroidota bacterium]
MHKNSVIRLFVLLIVASFAVLLVSHKQAKSNAEQDCINSGKCEKKAQSDFIFLEPISRHLLPTSDD